jgi:hypothetical protein
MNFGLLHLLAARKSMRGSISRFAIGWKASDSLSGRTTAQIPAAKIVNDASKRMQI